MPTFSHDLSHAAQLDLLERLTRAALTEHYGLDGAAAAVEVQQYEDNAVWRITPPDRDNSFVARLSIRDGRPAHQQRSEMRWLESLASTHTVAVPDPVTTTSGHYVVPVEVPDHDEPATLSLLHWLPGTAEPPYRQPGVAQKMGAATACLHEHAATVHLPDFDRPVWDAQTILHHGHALTGPGSRDQLGAAGTAALRKITDLITPALAEGGPNDRGRIHGDLHRENMIALPDGGVGIIDFDDCGTGHYLLDIATVLSSVHRIAHTEPGGYEGFARGYLDGYTQVRPLPTDFSRLLESYLLLRDVQILNFVTTAAPRERRRPLLGAAPYRRHPGEHAGIPEGTPLPGHSRIAGRNGRRHLRPRQSARA